MYGIPDPFPSVPSLKDIRFATGNVSISFLVLIVATEAQSIDIVHNPYMILNNIHGIFYLSLINYLFRIK